MNKAIFFKEWLKTRWYFLAMSLVSVGFTIYAILRINRVVSFKGAGHLWSVLLTRDTVFVEQLACLPLLCGMLLAVAQFVPEVTLKRLKLTLHLPYPQRRMILMMSGMGLLMLTLLFVLQAGMLVGYLQSVVPVELVSRIMLTSLPWFACGWGAYLFTAAICLEPTWKMRLMNALVFAGMARLHYLSAVPEAYDHFVAWLCLADLCVILLPLRSVSRFREGCQD